ncbi:hypothetical protein TRIUR3_12506 [Triticum urartu]|uniref:Uncharacterized protein n=1 Tax=Triticum urartu TaxID=4572 RepID=M7ZY68_TRIUA|nr:hypothetical protein TRIUR3_12506 [Triticum urartu]
MALSRRMAASALLLLVLLVATVCTDVCTASPSVSTKSASSKRTAIIVTTAFLSDEMCLDAA